MRYLIVATIRASDNTTGRISRKTEDFDSTIGIMKAIKDFVTKENGEIVSIYVKTIKEEV